MPSFIQLPRRVTGILSTPVSKLSSSAPASKLRSALGGDRSAPRLAPLLVNGVLAGAIGTIALDAATYADIALRGRPESDAPAKGADIVAHKLRVPLGRQERAEHREEGLGALAGYALGIGVGALYGLLRRYRTPNTVGSAALLGLVAMVASDAPLAALRVSDPTDWSIPDWLSDTIPHAAYGAVTAVAFDSLRRGTFLD